MQPTIITLKKVNRDYNITTKMGPRPFTIPGARDGDLITTGNVSFPSSLDGPTIYKYFNNMTINAGHTVTTSNRCKGLVITCLGDCTINGSLSMTARGCRGVGENFAPHGINNVVRASDLQVMNLTIGANGGAGGASVTHTNGSASGRIGSSGINGAGGGGGSGGASGLYGYRRGTSGTGASGTSYSGGSGGSGSSAVNTGTYTVGGNGGINGGPGGNSPVSGCGGGAGNPGGLGWSSVSYYTGTNGGTGTGGLIILIVNGNLIINGNIRSNGTSGGYGHGRISGIGSWNQCGGSSGGGGITVLYKGDYTNSGSILANGGFGNGNGGAGGSGSIRVHKIV